MKNTCDFASIFNEKVIQNGAKMESKQMPKGANKVPKR